MKELLGERYQSLLGRFTDELDRAHEDLTGATWAGNTQYTTTINITHRVEQEASHLRRLLG